MGVFEFVFLGASYVAMFIVFFIVLALELRKSKNFQEQTANAILRSTMKLSARITLIVLSALIVLGAPVVIILCSLLIEPVPKGIYGVLVVIMALFGLFCLCCTLASFLNGVCATEEGVWVRYICSKSKFYGYQEIVAAHKTKSLFVVRMIYCIVGREVIFSLNPGRDTNAVEMVNLIEKHCPYLPGWDD